MKRYRVILCDLSFDPEHTPLVQRHRDCPNWQAHTPDPEGYIAWHEWAKWMARRGAKQKRCPGCKRWAIWTSPVAPTVSTQGTAAPR